MSEIDRVIEKIVSEKTFSLEAVEAIKTMRNKLEATYKAVKASEKSCDEYKEKLKQTEALLTGTTSEIAKWREKEKVLIIRENNMLRLECNVEKHIEVREAYINCFNTIFKNTIIREQIQKDIVTPLEGTPGVSGGMGSAGYGQKDQVTESKETTKE